jgi:hypothetical protein
VALEEAVEGVERAIAGDAAGEDDPGGRIVDDHSDVVVLRTPKQLNVEAVGHATAGDMASSMRGEVLRGARHFSPLSWQGQRE